MNPSRIVLIFLLFVLHNALSLEADLPMERWSEPTLTSSKSAKPSGGLNAQSHFTWHAETAVENKLLRTPGTIEYQDVLNIAHRHFNWLKNNEPRRYTGRGTCMVAVMFDPSTKKFYASTVPQGSRKLEMLTTDKEASLPGHDRPPMVWWEQFKSTFGNKQNPNPREVPFHAEDGVYFNWEIENWSQISNGKYPVGAIMAVWGHVKNPKDKPFRYFGKDMSLCSGGINPDPNRGPRIPSCQDVAKALGVTFRAGSEKPEYNLADEDGSQYSSLDIEQASKAFDVCLPQKSASGKEMRRDAEACDSLLSGPQTTSSPPLITPRPGGGPVETHPHPTGHGPPEFVAPSPVRTSAPPSPMPTCFKHNQDPDQHVTAEFCVCDETRTLPLLSTSPNADYSAACAYTSLPSSDTTVTAGFGPATTDTILCQVCSQVVNNEDSCSTLSGCIPQTALASVTVATSALHVGTLTSDVLYTSVSSALESICPPVTQTTSATQCSGTVTIKDIIYVKDELLVQDGELQVTTAFSSYNETSLRDAMIRSLAQSANVSATGKNCYDAEYEIMDKKRRRSWFGLKSRFADRPVFYHEHKTICNMAELALVNYYDPYWRQAPEPGATDYIEAQYNFHEPPGGDFDCEFLGLLIDSLVVIAPEFAVGEVKLSETVEAVCEHLQGN